MAARLDKSLDEIISTQRRSSSRGGRGRRGGRTAPATTAPVGGVKKNPKHAKGVVKNAPTGPSGSTGEGKILVSGFVSIITACPVSHMLISGQPKDINEPMIKVCYR
jgi:THO complex subunit 4